MILTWLHDCPLPFFQYALKIQWKGKPVRKRANFNPSSAQKPAVFTRFGHKEIFQSLKANLPRSQFWLWRDPAMMNICAIYKCRNPHVVVANLAITVRDYCPLQSRLALQTLKLRKKTCISVLLSTRRSHLCKTYLALQCGRIFHLVQKWLTECTREKGRHFVQLWLLTLYGALLSNYSCQSKWKMCLTWIHGLNSPESFFINFCRWAQHNLSS